MRVSDIWEEVKETTGTCDDAVNYRALTRAVELLANEGSFDPLLGTIDFYVENAFLIALPRDVKTPLRLNINNNPSFARNRIFEFAPNTNGSQDGSEVGWQWHERGYSVIQDETKLPSKLRYNVTVDKDVGRTITICGRDTAGRTRKETLAGATLDHPLTKYAYAEILSITRQATSDEAYLWAEGGSIGRYYPDEEQPEYRVIKLSQTGVAVRMLYRKHVFKLSSQYDIIPLHSAMAVIRAVEAVRLMQKQKFADAQPILAEAVRMIGKEQETRDEGATLASAIEVQTVTNTNILTNDVLLMADIYDRASEIIGTVGRNKVFDRTTDAIELLQNKTQWDSLICNADVCRAMNMQDEEHGGRASSYGFFVLPRYVDTVLAVNIGGEPASPRNRWFEFHLNGPGSRYWHSCDSWEDAGDVCTINGLPRERIAGRSRSVIPCRLLAVPDNALDVDKQIRAFGIERLADGTEVEVCRGGQKGYLLPQKIGAYTFPGDAPQWVRIDRIHRGGTAGFVKLIGKPTDASADLTLGYYYPDEVSPRYRMIKVGGCGRHGRIRIRFRKRTYKISALTDTINLRSRLAIENALRAIMKQGDDPQTAAMHEAQAVQYLEEEQLARNPHGGGTLQFEPGMAPGDFMNIQ